MDNILVEKIYDEEELLELKIVASNEYVNVIQNCYMSKTFLAQNANKLIEYTRNPGIECYLNFGEKKGEYTPAFSMNLFSADKCGHVKIEMDMEIDDNNERCHRCSFYVRAELGLVENFGKGLIFLIDADLGSKISIEC